MLNLVITINEPTRVTPTTSTSLDNILINTNLDYHLETTDLGISDHNAQILSLKLDNQLLEWNANQRLNSSLEKERIITNSQFGFRQNRNTTDASFALLEKINQVLESKQLP
ncbi:hypothetical protein JTB14_031974 [Gonioctena quinquepunctata]|nr:hypothetical protein JTB14_031974 [Gonioctena quinquepunctata]